MAETNHTIIETIVEYQQLFVGAPGRVIGGWVGFGLFIGLVVLTILFVCAELIPFGADFYELIAFSFSMVIVYLLAATEQFILLRDENDRVSLLMVATNCIIWLWAILASARRLPPTDKPVEMREKYARIIGIFSQILPLISAFVRDGVIFALWAFTLVMMFVCLGHYYYTIIIKWSTSQTHSRIWLYYSLFYTITYAIISFLSHLYLQVLSLSGAVWAYLAMHILTYVFMLFMARTPRGATVISLASGSAIKSDELNH